MLRKLEALISAGGQGQAQSSGATHKAGGEANEAGGSSVHNSAQHQWGEKGFAVSPAIAWGTLQKMEKMAGVSSVTNTDILQKIVRGEMTTGCLSRAADTPMLVST